MGTIRALCRDDTGATGIEYGFLASLVAVALVSAFDTLGNEIDATFGHVHEEYDAVN